MSRGGALAGLLAAYESDEEGDEETPVEISTTENTKDEAPVTQPDTKHSLGSNSVTRVPTATCKYDSDDEDQPELTQDRYDHVENKADLEDRVVSMNKRVKLALNEQLSEAHLTLPATPAAYHDHIRKRYGHLTDDELASIDLVPPPPNEPTPDSMIERVRFLFESTVEKKNDLNEMIRKYRNFRNPSIYSKLVELCSINELGTNYK